MWRERSVGKGMLAGLVGGLIGTIVMTEFQNAWNKASNTLKKDNKHRAMATRDSKVKRKRTRR